jgi:hypothetical protein
MDNERLPEVSTKIVHVPAITTFESSEKLSLPKDWLRPNVAIHRVKKRKAACFLLPVSRAAYHRRAAAPPSFFRATAS